MSNKRKVYTLGESLRLSTLSAVIGAVACFTTVLTDLLWLIGDMYVAVHPHHYYIFVGLVIGLLVNGASWVWLYRCHKMTEPKKYGKIKVSKHEVNNHGNV